MPIDFPANPTNGQVYANYIYDSSITAWRNVNTDTGIGTLNAMGLKNVAPTSVQVGSGSATTNANGTVTFTGASSISLNGIFSDTYKNYKLILDNGGTVQAAAVYLRFRNAGTDNSGANYYYAGSWDRSGGTVSAWSSAAANQFDIGRITPNWSNFSVFDITGTRDSGKSVRIFGGFVAHDGTSLMMVSEAGHTEQLAPYDGLSLICTSGTFTGTIKIYGYNG